MKLKSSLLALALLLGSSATLVQTGCVAVVAAGAGAGAVAWVRGELSGDVDAPVDEALRAANRAIVDLKFAKVSEKADALSGMIVARTADDTKVEIKVQRLTDRTSKIRIRVGIFGNQTISRQIWDRIKAAL